MNLIKIITHENYKGGVNNLKVVTVCKNGVVPVVRYTGVTSEKKANTYINQNS